MKYENILKGKTGATEAFAFFNLLSAGVLVYILITSEEGEWFQLCKKRRSNDEMLEDYETKIKGDSLFAFFHYFHPQGGIRRTG